MVIVVQPKIPKGLNEHTVVRQHIISTSLEEGHFDFFLNNIYAYLDDNFYPAVKHVHVLFYLAIRPPAPDKDHDYNSLEQYTAIGILDRMLMLYPTSVFRQYIPYPGQQGQLKGDPRWAYEVSRKTVEEQAMKLLNRCNANGVYDLFWRGKQSANGHSDRKSRGRRVTYGGGTGSGNQSREGLGGDEEEEEEEGEEKGKDIDENAWDLVEWFVRLWKKSQAEYKIAHPDQPAYSPLFIDQFRNVPSNPGDLQISDLSSPLSILRTIYKRPSKPTRIEGNLIKDILSLIIVLLQGSSPLFHTPSFPMVLLPFLRSLPPTHLDHFLTIFSQIAPLSLTSHLITILIEDLGGTRLKRGQYRRDRLRKSIGGDKADSIADLDEDRARWEGNLAPPTVAYFLRDLLPLPVADMVRTDRDVGGNMSADSVADGVKAEKREKMGLLKVRLLPLLDEIFPLDGPDVGWGEVLSFDRVWRDKVLSSVDERSQRVIEGQFKAIEEELVPDDM